MEISEILQQENTLLLVKSGDLQKFAERLAQEMLVGQPKFLLPQDEEKPLSQLEAIKFMGKSRQSFYSWRKKGIITAYRLAGRIYYKKAELIGALEKLR
jgi:hypothetical protein